VVDDPPGTDNGQVWGWAERWGPGGCVAREARAAFNVVREVPVLEELVLEFGPGHEVGQFVVAHAQEFKRPLEEPKLVGVAFLVRRASSYRLLVGGDLREVGVDVAWSGMGSLWGVAIEGMLEAVALSAAEVGVASSMVVFLCLY
jgi:hypothetical protein